MTDGRRPRSYGESSIDRRVTVIEVEMRNLGRRLETHVEASDKLLGKLDERADRQDVLMARVMAGVTIAIFLAQLLAPIVRQAIFGGVAS